MRKQSLVIGLALCVLLLAVVGHVFGQEAKSLKVKVTYTGEGEVGGTAGIHVYLFDTPDIAQGAMPVEWKSAYKNGEVLTFHGLTKSPVYMVAGYGDYSLMGPPPSGTPVTMYKPGESSPTPIDLVEDVVEVDLTFDDTNRMP